MAMILLPRGLKGPAKEYSRRSVLVPLLLVLAVVPLLTLYAGYKLGVESAVRQGDTLSSSLRYDLENQREQIESVRRDTQEDINALTLRLAELQSRSIRLDALGQRLTEMADLDQGEFDFESPPAQGGPVAPGLQEQAVVADFMISFDELTKQMDDRERQLAVLESLLMTRGLEDEVFPAGFPAEKGWISSYFGMRTDPFTGRPARHEGIDIAGKAGTGVLAVAAGVVTWADDRYGYGELVEINHGNGYVTRYGHNSEILVAPGDTVKKGQVVAKMGSSGRSTGPHVHFEVLRHGRVVDPVKYVRSSRR